MEPTQSNKTWIWVIVVVAVVIVAGLVWWYMLQGAPRQAPVTTGDSGTLSGGDKTADIEKDLSAVDLGEVDKELNALDTDINQL